MKTYEIPINPLRPYSRGVSIIGVGATPNMHMLEDPNLNGLIEGELVGYAAIEAMKEANVTAKDVDFFVLGQAAADWASLAETPAMHVASWFGMKGKGNCFHSEACCTGYVGIELGAAYIASGAYDMVLVLGTDTSHSLQVPKKPAYIRRAAGLEDFLSNGCDKAWPQDYSLTQISGADMCASTWLDEYVRENHLEEKIDEIMATMTYNARTMAAKDPYALTYGRTYEMDAEKMGFQSAQEFLRSPYNPKLDQYMHVANFEEGADGAAAVLLCASDIAKKYTEHPVEVLGIGHATLDVGVPRNEKAATIAAYKQVRDLTGLTGADMDLFMVNDFAQASQFLAGEAVEYLPEHEGWKAIMEGRCMYNGDRPINTNGGRCHFGASHGTSGLQDLFHAVKQMRGEMGETQITHHKVRRAMLRGFGGGQNVTCGIFEYR